LGGVFFIKHPDLRRILTDYGFTGHPLHKDFPLSGFYELTFQSGASRIEYKTIELTQSVRIKLDNFNFIVIKEDYTDTLHAIFK